MIFQIDGKSYDVRVTALKRKFSVEELRKPGYTMDGKLHREILGTYYHYTMTVEAYPGKEAQLQDLWQAVSAPAESHLCRFPYGQQDLQQQMYITGGSQDLQLMQGANKQWGSLTLEFTAIEPEVLP